MKANPYQSSIWGHLRDDFFVMRGPGSEELIRPWRWRQQCPVCLLPTYDQPGLSGEDQKPRHAVTHCLLPCPCCCYSFDRCCCPTHSSGRHPLGRSLVLQHPLQSILPSVWLVDLCNASPNTLCQSLSLSSVGVLYDQL